MRFWFFVIFLLTWAASWANAPVVLRYACQDGSESIASVRQIVAEFEAAHPNIKIKIEQVTDEFFMRMLTQYAAKVAPDMAQMHVGMVPQFAVRGALKPLEEFAEKSPDLDLSLWYPNVLKFFSSEGNLWALPRDVAPFGLIFYNKAHFREAGIPYPDDTWTWTTGVRPELREKDFIWVMRELTKKNAAGKTTRFGFAPDWPQLYFYLLLQSRGLKLWNDDAAPTKIIANDPETVELMEFASSTINKENWIPSWDQIDTVARSTVYDEFVKGRISMITTFASKLGQLRQDLDRRGVDWDVTLFPAYEGRPLATSASGSGTVIFSTTKHPEEAWLFTQWMSGERGQRVVAKYGGQPARRDLALEPGVWLPGPNADPKLKKPANLAVTDKAALAMQWDMTPEYFEDTRLNLDSAAFDILSGSRPPKETLERVTREGQIRLDAALRAMPKEPFPMGLAIGVGLLFVAGLVLWLWLPEKGVNYTLAEKKESLSAYKFLAPLLIGLLFLTLGPFLYSFILSLTNSDMIRPPLWRGLSNYTDALTIDPIFWTSVRVTLVYAAISVPLSTAVALGLAVLLNQKVKGVPLYRAMYYIPSLVSGVAASLIWMRVLNPENGILNNLIYGPDGQRNLLGLGMLLSQLAGTPGEPINWLGNEHTVLPAFVLIGMWGAGGGTIIFLAALQGVPQMYYDAARIDGTTPVGQFRHVTLPLITPALFFALITGTIGAFQAFTQAFVITQGGPNNATMFYMLNLYISGFKSLKMGYASALAWLLFALIMAITIVQLVLSKRWVYYEGEER